jgi:hypothetical protein
MGNRGDRGSVLAHRRREAYQRLLEIDAHRLRLAGGGIEFIAGRAVTTPYLVRRWLEEAAARDTDPAQNDLPTRRLDFG